MSALSQSRGSGGTLEGGLAAARRVDLHDDGGFGFIGVYPDACTVHGEIGVGSLFQHLIRAFPAPINWP